MKTMTLMRSPLFPMFLICGLAAGGHAQETSDAVARLTQSVQGLQTQNADLRAQLDRVTQLLDGVVKENGRLREAMGRLEGRLTGARATGAEPTADFSPLAGAREKPWLADLKAMEDRFAAKMAVLEARIDALYGRKPGSATSPFGGTNRVRPDRDGTTGRVRPDARPRAPQGTNRERADVRAKRAGGADEARKRKEADKARSRKDARDKRPKAGAGSNRDKGRTKRPI